MADADVDEFLKTTGAPKIGALSTVRPVVEEVRSPVPEAAPTTAVSADPDVAEFMASQKGVPLREQFVQAAAIKPDAYAKSKQLAEASGLPTEVVARNEEVVSAEVMAEQAMFGLGAAPVTQRWLEDDPERVKIASDSVSTLTKIEKGLEGFARAIRPEPLWRSAGAGAVDTPGMSLRGLGELYNIAGRALAAPIKKSLDALGMTDVREALETPIPWWMSPGEILKQPGQAIGTVAKAIDIPPEDKRFVDEVAGGVGQVAAQITAMIVTGGAASAGMLLGQGADQVAGDVQKAGKAGTPEGDLATVAGAGITAVTEKFGLDLLLNKIPASVKSHIGRILVGATTEAAQEITEKVLNNVVALELYDPNRTMLDKSAFDEGLVAGTVGAIVSAVIPGKRAISRRDTMDKTVEQVAASPLTQRDPSTAASHLAETLRGTDIRLPVAALDMLGEADPTNLYARLGITETRVEAARARGGDIVVSEDAFAAEFVLDPVRYTIVRDLMRYGGPEELTAAEAAELPVTMAEDQAAPLDPIAILAQEALAVDPETAKVQNTPAMQAVPLAEQQLGLQGLFNTAAEAGLTQTEYEDYLGKRARATEVARTRQAEKALKQQERQLSAEWAAEREAMRPEVEADVRSDSMQAAIDSLGAQRLDREATLAILQGDEAALARLPKQMGKQSTKSGKVVEKARNIVAPKGEKGVDPDVLADQYGFESGDIMLFQMLDSYVPFDQKVDQILDQRMLERHGDLNDQRQSLQSAIEALHTDQQADVLAAELNALAGAKKAGAVRASTFKAAARQQIALQKIKDVSPMTFLAEEARKAKLAGRLLRKGDRQGASMAKYQQLLNFEFARQSFRLAGQIESQRKQLERLANPSKATGTIDADFGDMIRDVLSLVDFSETLTSTDGKVPYRTMTVGEWNKMYEDVMRMRELGRQERMMYQRGQYIDFTTVKDELLAQVESLPTIGRVERQTERQNPSATDRLAGRLSSLQAAVSKVEFLLQKLDGGAMSGAWHKAIFEPIVDAQTAELDLLDKTVNPMLVKLKALTKGDKKRYARMIDVPELGRRMSMGDLLMVALNTGNASNLQKLVEGSAKDETLAQPWRAIDVENAMRHLGPDEAAWVQSVWDAFEAIRPQIEEVYRRTHGISPTRIEPLETVIGGVTVKGGYFPMMYDPLRAPADAKAGENNLMDDPFIRGAVFSGMTKGRVERYSAPVLLDLNEMPHAMRRAMHYATHYEPWQNVRKLLEDRQIGGAVRAKLGPEYHDELKSWLEAVATDNADRTGSKGLNETARFFRRNLTVAILGLSYTTLMAQATGVFTSAAQLGQRSDGTFSVKDAAKWTAVGWDEYLANPAAAIAEARQMSGEIRHRLGASERDIVQSLGELTGRTGIYARSQQASLMAIGYMQFYTVDMPTWMGALSKAVSEGKSTEDAVAYADTILRSSQGSGHVKDLTKLQRQKGFTQLVTMFSTFTSVLYNILSHQTGSTFKGVKNVPGAVAKLALLLALPAAADAFMRAEGPPEGEDEEPQWWALRTLRYAVQSVPVLGSPIAGAMQGFNFSVSPIENLGQAWVSAYNLMAKKIKNEELTELGEYDAKELGKLVKAVGLPLGLPGTNQLVRVLGAVHAEEDASLYDFLAGFKTEKERSR